VLEEILTWLGVAVAAAVAWGLYLVGENQVNQSKVKVEEPASDE
jgi:hypothetical protein